MFIGDDERKGKRGNRPPVWYMRQAGRALPNYKKLREKYSFEELMHNPELAAAVTLLPVSDLGVDAAIVFSDILSVPTALGMELEWTDHGPRFKRPLCEKMDPRTILRPDPNKLSHVYDALDIVKKRSQVPTIGFCGAPLTTLCYMLQGMSGRQEFPDARRYFYERPQETRYCIDLLTEFSIEHALRQIDHGIDAFQLFDTHAGVIPQTLYEELFLPAVKRFATAVRKRNIPFIYFPKGIGAGLSLMTPDVCDYVSVDWQTPLTTARRLVHPEVGLQGNIDPYLLLTTPERIVGAMESIYVPFFKEHGGRWILNLGHGVLANTPFDNLRFLTEWIKDENNWK
ncbi:MAG: uroporphyrinogen decarboxylase [Paludibacteraceae bacterium]|nr:uroporphyrinogen decarboxylase [Paludibacteraceae bacterium]MBP5482626.1 uroporphyrinogen decarboxylase [Paludibacteraceae bacterium]